MTRILVADDDADIRSLVTDVVERDGELELVGAAGDAEEAIRLAEELEPDVIVMDWAMPGGGGDKASQQITSTQPSVKVVGISAMNPSEASYVMSTSGAVAFLGKPFKPDELISAIRSAARW